METHQDKDEGTPVSTYKDGQDAAFSEATDTGPEDAKTKASPTKVTPEVMMPEAPPNAAIAKNKPVFSTETGPILTAQPGTKKQGETPKAQTTILSTSTTNQPQPTHRLEAYILRPRMETSPFSTTWSMAIESLHLDETAIQAHINKLGPDYSVIDSISALSPKQISLIKEHTASCNGRLVSVQQSLPAKMVTQMGSLEIKPVIFIIKAEGVVDSTGKFGGFLTTALPQTTFGQALRNNGCLDPGFQSTLNNTSGIFGSTKATSSVALNNSNRPVATPNPPREYRDTLRERERGNDGFFNEISTSGDNKVNRYMTITAGDRYRSQFYGSDRSLEELRVADYAAGRTGPTEFSGIKYPWEQLGKHVNSAPSASPFGSTSGGGFLGSAQSDTSAFGSGSLDAQRVSSADNSYFSQPYNTAPPSSSNHPAFGSKPKAPTTTSTQSSPEHRAWGGPFRPPSMKLLQSISAKPKPFTYKVPSMLSTSTPDGSYGTTATTSSEDTSCWLCETPIKGNATSQPEAAKPNAFKQRKLKKEKVAESTPLVRTTDAVLTTELQKPIDTKCYFDFDGKTWSNTREQVSASDRSAVFRFGGQNKGSEEQATVIKETEGDGETKQTGKEGKTED
jgi:hypothetical protein